MTNFFACFSAYDRATIIADPEPPPMLNYNQPSLPPIAAPLIGTGDAATAKDAEKIAAYHACLQLGARGLFNDSNLPNRRITKVLNNAGPASAFPALNGAKGGDDKTAALSNGTRIGLEEARAFMDYYC